MGRKGTDSTWQGDETWIEPEGEGAEGEPERAPDRYELRELLGQGASGKVWLAWDTELQREVAYKALNLSLGGAAGERFLQEARLTAGLEHPGVVPVHDAGRRPDGGLYYVMQVIRGRALSERIAACSSPAERLALIDCVVDACQAVAYAHERRIIHRDLKPQNIMVGELGEVRVVDWGLARALPRGEAPRPEGIAGSPRYMSPEQASGQPVDARSDVWALGSILYELLAGRPRVEGDGVREVLARIARGELPSVESIEGPPELLAIIARALQHRPEDRYPDAGALLHDLRAWRTGQRVGAYQYSPAEEVLRLVRRYRWPLTGVAAALVVVGLVAAEGHRRTRAERDRAIEAEQISLRSEAEAVAAREQMARALQESYLGEANRALEAGDVVGALIRAGAALELGPAPRARGLAAHLLDQVPYRWRAGGVELPGRCAYPLVWSDGSVICAGPDGVWRVDGGRIIALDPRPSMPPRPVADGSVVLIGDASWWRVLDPVSQQELFASDVPGSDRPWAVRKDGAALVAEGRDISRVDLRTGQRLWTQRTASLIGRVAWVGDQVLIAQAAGVIVTLDGATGAPRGQWKELAHGGAYHSEFSRDGQWLVHSAMGGFVGLVHADGRRVELRSHGRRGFVGWSDAQDAVFVSDGDGITVWTVEGERIAHLPVAGSAPLGVAMPDADRLYLAIGSTLREVERIAVARARVRALPFALSSCVNELPGTVLCGLTGHGAVRIPPRAGEITWLDGYHAGQLCATQGGIVGSHDWKLTLYTGSLPAMHLTSLTPSGGMHPGLICGAEGRWATYAADRVIFARGATTWEVAVDEEVLGLVPAGDTWWVRTESAWSRVDEQGRPLGEVARDRRGIVAVHAATGKAAARAGDGLQIIDLNGETPPIPLEGGWGGGPATWIDAHRLAVADAQGLRIFDSRQGRVVLHADPHGSPLAVLHEVTEEPQGPLLLAGDHESRLFSWDLSVLDLTDDALRAQIERATGLRAEAGGVVWAGP